MSSKNKRIFIISLIPIVSLFTIISLMIINKNKNNSLVNINQLTPEYVEKYFDEYKKLSEQNEKSNILIITTKEQLDDTYGATKVVEAPNNQYFLQYETEEEKERALKSLNTEDSNVDVSENLVREISEDIVLVSNYNSWGVEAMGIDTLLDGFQNKELNNVTVAIIDTGLDVDVFNEKFSGRLAGAYNVLENNDNMYDNEGHGTHIAGTIAESTPDNVKILPIKISDSRYMYETDIITAINYITYNKNADIINMSYGSYIFSKAEYIAIEAAKENNIISVAAAGNDNSSESHYPSALDNTISIAAVDSDKAKASFSNYGNSIMFSTPGVNIKSIASKEENQVMSGTSMATPHAVGAISILKSLNKNLTFEDTITILRRYSDDLGDLGWDEYFGYGFINFSEASVCDGIDCDEYNVFKKSERDNLEDIIESYEIEPNLTTYNYGSINNILNTKIIMQYKNGKTIEYFLYNIKNLEMSEYDPYSSNEQTISIKFTTPLGIEIDDSFEITNPSNYENVWEYQTVGNNNIEITNYKDTSFTGNTLYFPSMIDGYTVTGIADGDTSIFTTAWNSFLKVRNLYLPATLTKIGKKAFSNSNFTNGLTYVKSEAESIYIGDYAFRGSQSLDTLEATVSYVGDYAFKSAMNLKNIQFSNDITYIGKFAFQLAFFEAKITIPESVTEIGEYAFHASGLKEIEFKNSMEVIPEKMMCDNNNLEKVILPKNLKEIGESAFYGCEKLTTINLPESLTTIEANAFYGSFSDGNLTIPKNVTTIGENALKNSGLKEVIVLANIEEIPSKMLYETKKLEKVVLPESLIKIKVEDFYNSNQLKEIYFGKNITSIEVGSFENIKNEIKFYVYNNTLPKTFAEINNINYEQIDPDEINIKNIKSQYFAFEKINKEDISLELVYNEKITRTETINENIEIEYPNSREDFRFGDTSVKITSYNKLGYKIEKNVEIEVVKLTPEYEIPKNLVAEIGQALYDIQLPENFEWVSDNVLFEIDGNQKFIARYIPEDTENYNIIENIEINIVVGFGKTIIRPTLNISNKIFNGDKKIDKNMIVIPELSASDYTILYAETLTENVGETTAKIVIKLSDEKFKNYAFDGNIQAKEFEVNINITPKLIKKPTLSEKTYIYNGLEQTVELIDYEENIMTVEGNKRKNAGEQNIIISLENSNYVWEDGTNEDVILKFKIEKAIPKYTVPTNLKANISQKLSDITLPSNFKWMNPDEFIEESGNIIFKAKYIPEDTTNYNIIENIEITINVSIKIYTITFNSNDEKTLVSIQVSEHNKKSNLNANTFERKGFEFTGWNTKPDGTGIAYSDKHEISITEDLILYAQWKEKYSYIINKYSYDDNKKYIDMIDVNTTVNDFKKNIDLNIGYSIVVSYKTFDGKSLLYTGSKTIIYNNSKLIAEYTNIIRGDVNGDGKINYLDYVNVYNHIQKVKHPELDKKELKDEYLISADMSGEGIVNYLDYVQIYNKIKELKGGN